MGRVTDSRKLLAIEKLIEGEMSRVAIAEMIGISRQTLYSWMNNELFVAEMDERLLSIKSFTEKKIQSQVDFALTNLLELARDDSNRRVQAQVNQYLLDRALGKPTSKVELEAGIKEQPTGTDILEAEFTEFDTDV